MVKMTYSAEKQVQHEGLHEGLHRESVRQWLASQSALPKSDQHARKYRARVLRYLLHKGGTHARNMAVVSVLLVDGKASRSGGRKNAKK